MDGREGGGAGVCIEGGRLWKAEGGDGGMIERWGNEEEWIAGSGGYGGEDEGETGRGGGGCGRTGEEAGNIRED